MPKNKSNLSRRAFLALTGGTGAGLMLNCGEKYVHKLIPYVNPPEDYKPGEWVHFASTCRECPAGCGLMTWHRDGRSTKAEGVPEHPVNNGKLCIRGQSSVQGEYDPDRLRNVLAKNAAGEFHTQNWNSAFKEIQSALSQNGKLKFISDLQTGSLAGVIDEFTNEYNTSALYYEAFNYEAMRRANQQNFGQDVIPRYNLEEADLIVSFGADFLETWLSPVEYAAQFSQFHSLNGTPPGYFVYFGHTETMTATNADEFYPVHPAEEPVIILSLIEKLFQLNRVSHYYGSDVLENNHQLTEFNGERLQNLAERIAEAKNPIILAGRPNDKSVHGSNTMQAVNLLNNLLGSETYIDYSQPHALSNTALSKEVSSFFTNLEEDDVLIIHNTNPVYEMPEVKAHIERVRHVVYIGTMHNETANLARWVLPAHYPLEDWGDYEAWKGTVSLMQPTMRPIHNTLSPGDIFLRLHKNNPDKEYKDIVRSNWKKWSVAGNEPLSFDEDSFYKEVLRKGYIETSKDGGRPEGVRMNPERHEEKRLDNQQLPLYVLPSLFFYDGRLANRPWLQEIPHPVSNAVWQSWVNIHPETAKKYKLEEGKTTVIRIGNEEKEVVTRFTNSMAKDLLSIETGQGHWSMGKVANQVGINAFGLNTDRTSTGNIYVTIEQGNSKEKLLRLNHTTDQHNRELLQHVDLKELLRGKAEREEIDYPTPEGYQKEKDLYKPHEHKDHRWAMVFDLQKCIGCKACESACYAENNIPVLGKKNMEEGREMSWLKIVPYEIGRERKAYLPVTCQHCDSAPCEPVCPVYASVHTEEGLNAQIYNRCIGTRYCSNNCPYKVRRFNWTNVKREWPEQLQLNPEVTVRSRGVMEKCTFCVQRIRQKQYKAKKELRKVEDGEIVPACQQTCPTEAITFGDILDKNSKISKLMEDTRRYQLLHELNTKPAVVYLKKITQDKQI